MIIDLNESIYNLVKQDSKLLDILYDIGFKEIVKPLMLNTVGKLMNLKKGAKMRKIDIKYIIKKLKESGYEVKDE